MHNPLDPGYYESEELRGFGFGTVGENVRVSRTSTVVGAENVELGDHCRIDGYCTLIAVGGHIRVGRYVHVHTSVVIGGRGGVDIGDFAGVSHACQIMSASDDFLGRYMTNSTLPAGCTRPKVAPVRIGRHVPIGALSTVLPGVTVGEGAAICAHSLVTRDVPEWTVVAGNPAMARLQRSRRLLSLVPSDAKAKVG